MNLEEDINNKEINNMKTLKEFIVEAQLQYKDTQEMFDTVYAMTDDELKTIAEEEFNELKSCISNSKKYVKSRIPKTMTFSMDCPAIMRFLKLRGTKSKKIDDRPCIIGVNLEKRNYQNSDGKYVWNLKIYTQTCSELRFKMNNPLIEQVEVPALDTNEAWGKAGKELVKNVDSMYFKDFKSFCSFVKKNF
jgi:hypothetical protein